MTSGWDELPIVVVEHQPFAAEVLRVLDALEITGEPLPASETAELKPLAGQNSDAAVRSLQAILDRHCLAGVNINPESRVKAQEGPAKPELAQQGRSGLGGHGLENGRTGFKRKTGLEKWFDSI